MLANKLFWMGLAAVQAVSAARGADSMPLVFVSNHGQAPRDTLFTAKGRRMNAYFRKREAIFRMKSEALHVEFLNATGQGRVESLGDIPGEVNYLVGPEDRWQFGLRLHSGVIYRDLYPDIDAIYSASGPNFKSEFIVRPGQDPARIRMRYAGADRLSVEADGSLSVQVGRHQLRESKPVIYQERNGVREMVDGAFQVDGDEVSFSIGAYDRSLPLVIDPVLYYLTLLGGSGADAALALAVDAAGAAYVAGFTESSDLPTANPEQNWNVGGNEVFVAKLNAAGNGLVYCTYIGGRGDDRAYGIAVDKTGAAYLAGSTTSPDFPVRNALQPKLAGGKNAFVLKLSPAGNVLVFSSFLGGARSEVANGIALDTAGNVYVAGDTTSANFPASGFQKTLRGSTNGFVAKLAADGSRLIYSSYLGGSSEDHITALAVDAAGAAIVTGSTYSINFPVAGAYQAALAGGQDAFVAKFAVDGSALTFSTFLGGSGGTVGAGESGQGIAVDAQGNVYVAGVTSSTNFPVRSAAQPANAGWTDGFAAKLSAAGALLYSTYIGGVNADGANAIAVDASGNAYIAGMTASANLASLISSQGSATGVYDAFVVKLAAAGNAVAAVMYLGGSGSDNASAIVVDAAGNVYVAGWTMSPNFAVVNGFQTINGGNYSAFIGKVNFTAAISVGISPGSASLSVAQTQQFTATVANTSNTAVTWSISPAGVGSITSGGLYTAPASIAAQQAVTVTATSVADTTKTASATVTLYPAVRVDVSPSSASLCGGGTQQFTATVANTSNTAVTWSLNPALGSVSATGFYTAPATISASSNVSVTATSQADATKSASAVIALSSCAVTVTTVSIWPSSAQPGTAFYNDPKPVTLGTKFRSDMAGTITGIRFYKGAGNSGTHIGLLYSAGGALLAQATFTGETASGWQQVSFAAPVNIAANTTYIAAFYTTSGFAVDWNYFTNKSVDAAPLHALRSGTDGGNGVYAYAASPQFPTLSYADANYWVDALFAYSTVSTASGSIWSSATPATPVAAGQPPVTVGVKFRSDTAVPITGIRFYKGAGNTGTHIGLLYSGAGALLAQATFTGETASGWQQATFATPVTVAANTTYIAALFTTSGFAVDWNYFTSKGADAAPLHALRSGVDGGNGVYAYAASPQVPTQSYLDANYWVDVAYGTSSAPTPPPASAGSTIWPKTATPATPVAAGQPPVTVGVRFRSDVAGQVSAIRFYKGEGNSGTHVGLLYSSTGTLLAQATFTGETASGWQQVNFATSVSIAANTTYVAALFTTSGFAVDWGYFTGGVDAAPLHALPPGADGDNGVYTYGASPQFPTLSYAHSNYWVDVVLN